MKLRIAALAACAVLASTASPVLAQEEDEDEPSGEKLCDLHDNRLQEASGIAADPGGDGWWILPDGASDQQVGGMWIFRVGADCNVRDSESIYLDHPPLDPQALAVDSGGFVWAADLGEHDGTRTTVAITQIEPGNTANNVIFRLAYPDGLKHGEAFILLPDGKIPLVIPSVEGQAPIYMPTTEKQSQNTPTRLAGTVQLTEGGTVTGAALNADATKVVLRTATHAYEWEVKDGDPVQAMTDTEPLITELGAESRGQDITYGADGEFVTLAKSDEAGTFATITRYTPAEPEPEEPAEDEGGDEAAAEGDDEGFVDWLLGLGFTTIVRILTGIAIFGFLIMLAGILVIRKHRREHREAEADDEPGFAREESAFGDVGDDPLPPDPVDLGIDAGQPDPEVGQLAQSAGSVYGGPQAEQGGNVYGAPAAEEPSGTVYGAPKQEARPGPVGPVYGAPRQEPRYGAFEGAGHGSIYNDVGESFAVEPPPPPPPPAPAPPRQAAPSPPAPPAGGGHGAPREEGGSVYGAQQEPGGTVYGAGNRERTPEQDDDYWGPPQGGRGR